MAVEKYALNVLQDGSNKQRMFIVECGHDVDEKLLRVAGLVLDLGAVPEEIDEIDLTAARYVAVAKLPQCAGVQLISDERDEQVAKHGYGSAHDDSHINGELAIEAAGLAVLDTGAVIVSGETSGSCDTWRLKEKLAGKRIHQLKVAGALIAAEIDRLLRSGVKDE
jgi:hypothetical protein